MVSFSILCEFGRDSGQSLDAVRIGSNLDERPRLMDTSRVEGVSTRQDAASAPRLLPLLRRERLHGLQIKIVVQM